MTCANQVAAQSTIFDHSQLEQLVEQCQTVLVEQDIDSVARVLNDISIYSFGDDQLSGVILQVEASDFVVSVRVVNVVRDVVVAEKLVSCGISGSSELSLRMPDLTNLGSAALSAELTQWFYAFLDEKILNEGMSELFAAESTALLDVSRRQGYYCIDDNIILVFRINLPHTFGGMVESISLGLISREAVLGVNDPYAEGFRIACDKSGGQN